MNPYIYEFSIWNIKIEKKMFAVYIYYRPQRSWGKVIFSEACFNNSVHRGGMRGCSGGCAWLHRGVGMCGFIWGACMVLFGGHAWFYSGGVHGFIQGGGMHGFFQFFRIQ